LQENAAVRHSKIDRRMAEGWVKLSAVRG